MQQETPTRFQEIQQRRRLINILIREYLFTLSKAQRNPRDD